MSKKKQKPIPKPDPVYDGAHLDVVCAVTGYSSRAYPGMQWVHVNEEEWVCLPAYESAYGESPDG